VWRVPVWRQAPRELESILLIHSSRELRTKINLGLV
jgi:hypothetical protein